VIKTLQTCEVNPSSLNFSLLKKHARLAFLTLLIILSYGVTTELKAAVELSGFSPSAGWAGTNDFNGTRVVINGSGFDVDRDNNQVLFSNNIAAKVLSALPKDQNYLLHKTIGQSGSQDGGLDNPWDVAVDDIGNVYVANSLNRRIEVYDRRGDFVRNNYHQLNNPTRVAINNAGQRIYVVDAELGGPTAGLRIVAYQLSGGLPVAEISLGSGVPARDGITVDESTGAVYYQNLKFNSNLQYQRELDLPLGSSFVVSNAFHQGTQTLLILDNNSRVLRYKNDSLDSEFSITVQGEAYDLEVDFKGDIYVSSNTFGLASPIRKLDGATGKLIARFGNPNEVATGIAVDSNTMLYGAFPVDGCQCIEVFAPSGSEQLIVAVPPGAVDGLITVTTPEGTTDSVKIFKVLDDEGPVTLDKFEVTQGLETNPLVRGKETLMYLRFNGRFGDPGRDSVSFQVTDPNGKQLLIGFPLGWDDIRYDDRNNKTTVMLHIPRLSSTGDHEFFASANHGGTSIAQVSVTRRVYEVKGFPLLFVKFDSPEEEGSPAQPYEWFDTRTFLSAIDLLKRVLPVEPNELTYNFHETLSSNHEKLGADLSDDAETDIGRAYIRGVTSNIGAHYADKTAFRPEKTVGLVDAAIRPENVNITGWAGFGSDSACTFFTADQGGGLEGWAKTLAHELGHTLKQVAKGKKNYIKFEAKGGDNHTKNITLENEKGAPITAWNPITDGLIGAESAVSIMSWGSSPRDMAFFESQYSGPEGDEDLEYRSMLRQRNPEPGFKTQSFTRVTGEKQYVIIGTITDDGEVTIETSYVRDYAEEPTPAVRSDLELVFLDGEDQVLSQTGFLPESPLYDTASDSSSSAALFSLVRPLPENTARVEIRLLGRVLKSIVPSNTVPSVSDVSVTTREFGPYTIGWSATDADGDELNYAVYYSTDGGQSFIPIAVGLSDTRFSWNHAIQGGSSSAVIEVVAGDGFHRGSALSAPFTVPTKAPVVSIITPKDGEQIMEGSTIQLRGSAYDPEDGVLSGDSMIWEVDGVTLASGNPVRTGDRTILTPAGPVSLPMGVGSHTVALTVTDKSGASVRSEINVMIVADTDRDGKSDEDETNLGSDPYDPAAYPSICGDGSVDLGEQCDDGNIFNGDMCSAICEWENSDPFSQCRDRVVSTDPGACSASINNASIDNGSLDPNRDPIVTMQTPTGPYSLGATNVTLTVTDDRGGADSCSATVLVLDKEVPSIAAPVNVVQECSSSGGTSVLLGTPTAVFDNCDVDLVVANDAPAQFPLGLTSVNWTAKDDAGNIGSDTQDVTVVDTTPPELSVELSPTNLWPPNHKLAFIAVTVTTTDTCDANPEIRLVSVTSNEPDNGLGDGDMPGDIVIIDDFTLELRAERSGLGDGRVYTVTYEAIDQSGNVTTEQATVTVAISQKKK